MKQIRRHRIDGGVSESRQSPLGRSRRRLLRRATIDEPSAGFSSGRRLTEIRRRRGTLPSAAARAPCSCTRRDRRSEPAAAARSTFGTGDTVPPCECLGPLHGACRWIDLRLEHNGNLSVGDDCSEQVVTPSARRGCSPFVRTLFSFYAIPLVHAAWLASARRARYRPPKPRPTTGQWRALPECLCSRLGRNAA